MQTPERSDRAYVLGSDAQELARLDVQAAAIAAATRLLLQAAGVRPGMRVLDLGTGLGHVARLVATLVGPTGAVVGLDASADALAVARQRAEPDRETPVSFIEGDVRTWRASAPFDAVVGRLILFHLADPAVVVRHHLHNLRADGLFVAIDFDVGAARTEPPVPVVAEAAGWVMQAFRAAGASPAIGTRLGTILSEAGLADVATFGIQGYLPARSPSGPALLAGVVRSLAGAMSAHGIATPEQIGIETLEQRIAEALVRADAAFLPPTVVGAWGRRSA